MSHQVRSSWAYRSCCHQSCGRRPSGVAIPAHGQAPAAWRPFRPSCTWRSAVRDRYLGGSQVTRTHSRSDDPRRSRRNWRPVDVAHVGGEDRVGQFASWLSARARARRFLRRGADAGNEQHPAPRRGRPAVSPSTRIGTVGAPGSVRSHTQSTKSSSGLQGATGGTEIGQRLQKPSSTPDVISGPLV